MEGKQNKDPLLSLNVPGAHRGLGDVLGTLLVRWPSNLCDVAGKMLFGTR